MRAGSGCAQHVGWGYDAVRIGDAEAVRTFVGLRLDVIDDSESDGDGSSV